jgi:hypothetical protein
VVPENVALVAVVEVLFLRAIQVLAGAAAMAL